MRTALILALALAAGLAAGYVLGREDALAHPDGIAWLPLPANTPDEDPLSDIEAAPDGPFPDFASALASITVPNPPEGDGVIHVIVKTKRGDPIPGVALWAEPMPTHFPKRESDPERRVRVFVANERWKIAGRRSATTDDRGLARLANLGGARYHIEARKEGHRSRGGRHGIRAGRTVILEAEPVVAVEVRVLMPDGTKATQTKVTYRARGKNGWWNWTERKRIRELEPDLYVFEATTGDLAAEAVSRLLKLGERAQPVTLRLK